MATTHNPGNLFNMDISGGIPSLMTRMIINSRPGVISLFPVLPDEWNTVNELSGVLVRGNIYIDKVKWDDESASIQLTSKENQKVIIDLGSDFITNNVKIEGAKYKVANNQLILFFKQNKNVSIELVRSKLN